MLNSLWFSSPITREMVASLKGMQFNFLIVQYRMLNIWEKVGRVLKFLILREEFPYITCRGSMVYHPTGLFFQTTLQPSASGQSEKTTLQGGKPYFPYRLCMEILPYRLRILRLFPPFPICLSHTFMDLKEITMINTY